MPQPPLYKHYLRTYDNNILDWTYWFYTVATGVDNTTTATELNRAPEGWKDYEIIFERGFTYYGLFTSFTTPLKFLKDGATILRHLKYTFGIETKVELLVEKRNEDWTYSTFFRGDIDMSKTQDEFDYLIAPIIEGGFVEKLKSRAETPYTYELWKHADRKWLEHDGIEMQALLKWTGIQNEVLTDYYPTLTWYDTEGSNFYVRPYSQDLTTLPFIAFVELGSNALSGQVRLTIRYSIQLYIKPNPIGDPGKLRIILTGYDNTSGTQTFTTVLFTSAWQNDGTTATYTGTINHNFTFNANEHLTITYVVWKGTGGITNNYFPTQYTLTSLYSEVGLYITNLYETTHIPVLKASRVFELLMESINDDSLVPVNAISTLLSTTLNDEHFLTVGDGVRSLENCTFTTSFADFFKWVNSKFGAALYYDRTSNTVYLESKTVVFNGINNPDYSITSVSNFKCIPFTEEASANLQMGSKNYDYDGKAQDGNEVTNGRDEWNITSNYLTPLTRLGNSTKEYLTPYRDDVHGIELVRANLTGKELADASTDNEIFAFHCNSTPSGTYTPPFSTYSADVHTLYRKTIDPTPGASYWQINNIFSPETAYNIFYTPARCVYRMGNFLRSLYKLNDADDLQYKGSSKVNTRFNQMWTSEGAIPTDLLEDDDIGIMSLCANDDVLFLPFIFEFDTKEEINLYNLINDNPFNYITFTYRGDTYAGYILKATTRPSMRGRSSFRLLATYDTDITNLIR